MTREDVKKLFPEATDEQITGLLNQNNSEIAKEKAKAEKLKSEVESHKTIDEENAGLKARIEELENEKLSEDEKRQKDEEKRRQEFDDKWKELEEANAKLQQQLNTEKIKSYAGSKNLSGEHIDTILNSLSGDYDLAVKAIDSMEQLIKSREEAAAIAKEQEIRKNSGNPGGQAGGAGEEDVAVRLARESAKRSNMANEDIVNHFRR